MDDMHTACTVAAPEAVDDGVDDAATDVATDDGEATIRVDDTAATALRETTAEVVDADRFKLRDEMDRNTREIAKIGKQLLTISETQRDLPKLVGTAVSVAICQAVPVIVKEMHTLQRAQAPRAQAPRAQAPQAPVTKEHSQGVLLSTFRASQIKAYAFTKGIAKKYLHSRQTAIEQLWLNRIPLPDRAPAR